MSEVHTPDKATVQWCIDRLSALIEKRVNQRKRKVQNRDDELIAAAARYLVTEYARSENHNG